MNYRIEEKDEMILTGYKRRFSGVPGERMEQEKEMFRTYFLTVAAVITAGSLISAIVMIVFAGMAYSIGVVFANVLLPLVAVMIVWFVAVLTFKKLYYKAA